jgi:hypothetical protein
MRTAPLFVGLAILLLTVLTLLAVVNANYRSTVSLNSLSYALIGLTVAISIVGFVQWIRFDSNPQTGFTFTINMRRNQPGSFWLRSLLGVVALSATAAFTTWYALKVTVPHISGSTWQTVGVIESMRALGGPTRTCNVLASIRNQANGIVVICYEWGIFARRRISDDDLSPGATVTMSMVTNVLGTAVTSVALVKL